MALDELNYPFPESNIREHWKGLNQLQKKIMDNREKYQGAILMSGDDSSTNSTNKVRDTRSETIGFSFYYAQ
jgi:hypothetical protein